MGAHPVELNIMVEIILIVVVMSLLYAVNNVGHIA